MSRLPPYVVRFRRILVAATAVAHAPFAALVADALPGPLPARLLGAALATAASVALFRRRVDEILEDRPLSALHREGLVLPYFVHWTALFAGSLAAVVAAPILAALGRPILPGLAACYALGLLLGAYGVYPGRRRFAVVTRDVPVTGLPAAFDGYRIVQLSDLHIGGVCPKEEAARWIRAAREVRGDLVVITGDCVTNGTAFHGDIAAALAPLAAAPTPVDGVVYAMGNHDYYEDGQPLRGLLAEAGVAVLRNEGRLLTRGGEGLYLAAVDDVFTGKADLDATFAGRPAGACTVLLAHDPRLWEGAIRRGAALTLSGHTHGGQLAVPFLARHLSLSTLANLLRTGRAASTPHLGLYRRGGATLFVHPGLGTTGPPLRIGVRAEVSVLVLRRAG